MARKGSWIAGVAFSILLVSGLGAQFGKGPSLDIANLKGLAVLVAKPGMTMTLYEGLPHQNFEAESLAKEKKAKKTVAVQGFDFYAEALPVKKEDAKKLTAWAVERKAFKRFVGPKGCGGFHPDWMIEWSDGKDKVRMQVCFGCGEVRIYGPSSDLYCDVDSTLFKPIQELLDTYTKNRPKKKEQDS